MFSLIQRLAARPEVPAASEGASARDERLRAAFAAVPVGLAVCGLDGRWLLFNDAAAEILGYTRQELSRVSLHELTHPADVPRENALLKRLHAGDVPRYRIEKRTLDRQAQYREVVVTAAGSRCSATRATRSSAATAACCTATARTGPRRRSRTCGWRRSGSCSRPRTSAGRA